MGWFPLDAGNGLLNAEGIPQPTFRQGFRWGAGLDIVAAVPHAIMYSSAGLCGMGYKSLLLSFGSKERYNSLLGPNLSSGDMNPIRQMRPI